MSHDIIHPEGWLPAKGYANGVLSREGVLHIGGQIGWDKISNLSPMILSAKWSRYCAISSRL